VIDCRDEKAYAAGHIPGAISLGGIAKVMRDTTLRARKAEDLEKLLGDSGVSMDKPVVVYADAKLITGASVAFWILEYLGHSDVRFLNGGIEEWQTTGKTLEKAPTKLPAASFKANVAKNRLPLPMKDRKGGTKNVIVIDSDREGEQETTRALRRSYSNTTLNVSMWIPHTTRSSP
jgi:thiosulfate/3-mercaptopyruvate sulfurtransferase